MRFYAFKFSGHGKLPVGWSYAKFEALKCEMRFYRGGAGDTRIGRIGRIFTDFKKNIQKIRENPSNPSYPRIGITPFQGLANLSALSS